ncbi:MULTISPECIES: hypothetical protein [Enterobacteriaceae]|uniref:Uncharacterized protein n=1 Tax=Raoultella lignicola TaxID=3040939 RepID=A0ABU9F438_9ENTR|nr:MULTISPECIES: hypothetical protein [Enterobacteriaceae]MRT50365.1 hypothetical protein [Raoultella sp. RIT712]QNK06125.1 hypothetical protein HF679_15000 [Enterobacter sp. JUb54]ROS07963.1 hypothetical protein EDF82_4396 [Raoultella sp. BIGb0399]
MRALTVLLLSLAIGLVTQRTTRWFLAYFAESREDPLIDLILTLTIAGGSLAAALYITRHWRQ